MSGFCSKKRKVLSDVRSETCLVRSKIISTGQSVWAKKIIFRPGFILFSRVTKFFLVSNYKFCQEACFLILWCSVYHICSANTYLITFSETLLKVLSHLYYVLVSCFLLLAFQSRHLTFVLLLCRYTEAATGGFCKKRYS